MEQGKESLLHVKAIVGSFSWVVQWKRSGASSTSTAARTLC